MRTIPGYPDPNVLITEPAARVTWNGMALRATDVSVKRGMSGGLPAQVAGGGTMMASTAALTVMPFIGPVSQDLSLPTGDVRLPRPGDQITIDLGLVNGRTPVYAPQLTGRVDSINGSVAGGGLQLAVVDYIDRLDRSDKIDPLYHLMPPAEGRTDMRDIGLFHLWVLDRMARRCGFHAIPPAPTQGYTTVHAPLMGTTWPELGQSLWSRPSADGGLPTPEWQRSPWGLAVSDVDAAYLPEAGFRLNQAMGISFMADISADGGHAPFFNVQWPSGVVLRVQLSASALAVQTYAAGGGSHLTRASMTHNRRRQVLVSVWVHPSGEVAMRIQDAGGEEKSAVGNISPIADMATAHVEHVRVYTHGPEISVGNLRVVTSATTFDLHDWTQTALMRFPKPNIGYIFTGIFGGNILATIKNWAQKTLGAAWLDEEGRLVIRHHYDMINPAPVHTLHVNQVKAADWSIEWAATKARVEVTFKQPVGRMRPLPMVTVWQGSGIALERGETHEELIHPGADETWFIPDEGLRFAWHGVAGEVNSGQHSWSCAVTEDVSAGTETQLDNADATGGLWRVDGRTWRITASAPGVPAGQQAHYRMPESASWLKTTYQGESLPMVRGYGKFTLEDGVYESTITGPRDAGTLTHDAGEWIQHPESAIGLANDIARMVTSPLHAYTGVQLTAPDDRIQIGDVLLLDWGNRADGTPWPKERVLVTGIEHQYQAKSGRTMRIDIQVLEVLA